jgi:hypothetical protein
VAEAQAGSVTDAEIKNAGSHTIHNAPPDIDAPKDTSVTHGDHYVGTVPPGMNEAPPDKYAGKTPEQLQEMHQAAERKITELSQGKEGLGIPKPPETPSETALSKWAQHYSQTGDLPEEGLKELQEQHGISKELAGQFVAGVQAMQQVREGEIMGAVGGSESYKAMVAWAGQNLSATEVQAYDTAVDGTDPGQAMMAVKGLQARWQATGAGVNPIQGSSPVHSGITPFRSRAEITAAQGDPKYASDPAYRNDVIQRLNVTPNNIALGG